MVMRDTKTKRLVEFNSTPDFDLKAVIATLESPDQFDLRKYYNEDLPLMEQNMTPHQFEQLETTHKKMLKALQVSQGFLEQPCKIKKETIFLPEKIQKNLDKLDVAKAEIPVALPFEHEVIQEPSLPHQLQEDPFGFEEEPDPCPNDGHRIDMKRYLSYVEAAHSEQEYRSALSPKPVKW